MSAAVQLVARIQSKARVIYYRLRYPRVEFGAHLGINGRLSIKGPGRVVIGEHCFFDNATGALNKIQTFASDAVVTIGDHCYINGAEIASKAAVTIEDRCILADCLIMDTDFHSTGIDRHNAEAHVGTRPVVIRENAWVGNKSIVLKGVEIGTNSVVGAGTVVRKDVPSNSIVIGNPQQVVKTIASEPLA